MSRSFKGSKPAGMDFGKKYKCDRKYSGGTGELPKDLANSERRATSKNLSHEAKKFGE